MIDFFLQEARNELINGYAKKKHPFRYFTLATNTSSFPQQRTVVLRKMLNDFTLVFFTDIRSQKIEQIKENNNVSALFYHPKKLLQISIVGKAIIEKDKTKLSEYWSRINDNSKKDYTTKNSPGSLIKNPDLVEYTETNNFCAVNIEPIDLEILQLKRPNHIRIKFIKKKEEWKGHFLTP